MVRFGGRFGEFVAGMFCRGAAFAATLGGFAVLAAGESLAQTQGSFEVHYAPEENLEAIDAGLIGSAVRTIDMDAYVLTDETVAEALAAAAARGVRVRVWRETSEPGLLDDDPGSVGVRFKAPGDLMHLKSYCVDEAILRTGSANFSHSGERYQDNDLVILRGPGACAGFEAKFERAWSAK